MQRVRVLTSARPNDYDITIGSALLDRVGQIARQHLGAETGSVTVISNKRVLRLYGSRITKSLAKSGFEVRTWVMREGERNKTLVEANRALNSLNDAGVDRSGAVVALGGGVVGDLAGFVASIYMRGIPIIHVPTTLLAQIDASVGGKTGVNVARAKNAIGTFHQPRAVIVDLQTLTTLPRRELVAGCCEMVKQGAIASQQLFKQTTAFLENNKDFASTPALEKLIAAHCRFKASVVAADEREQLSPTKGISRRILNFGHTVGHALEVVTNYKRFRHGEAVGHGMLAAVELSKNVGLLSESELELLHEAVSLSGRLPSANDVDRNSIVAALQSDKKRRSGHIQWVLLQGIGKPKVVDGREISPALIKKSLAAALTRK